ncbi:MAG TPA: hypothetical protein PLC82_02100 [Smithellaceae bacterium]|nr:hypothetical protein [Smithellaceae bacterium]
MRTATSAGIDSTSVIHARGLLSAGLTLHAVVLLPARTLLAIRVASACAAFVSSTTISCACTNASLSVGDIRPGPCQNCRCRYNKARTNKLSSGYGFS